MDKSNSSVPRKTRLRTMLTLLAGATVVHLLCVMYIGVVRRSVPSQGVIGEREPVTDLSQVGQQEPLALVWQSYNELLRDNQDVEIENPQRLIFVCCDKRHFYADSSAIRFQFKTSICNGEVVLSRFVPRYNSRPHKDCGIPMSASGFSRQSFLERVKHETEGTGGKYIVTQLSICKEEDQEIWNMEVDSMLQGEDTVSDAIKKRYALQMTWQCGCPDPKHLASVSP